ncbi:deoxyribodipyrimidine photo-lyase [Desertifilum sp. FACHB-1129]|uniref:Deoxyribodipyrimidine photolyase n=1 Tax=Desertifilum tharense IPPAS B-1220 TaxID=1781255 RepID=A0A1E5QR12_9CYAN|nr:MULTISPECIES: FAD-binding domain-containing protein [Desertifilum]MDA0210728.1 deoxyribodipyrimidine photo-lyase [Cyanobacteria bacterium FC1]MBD2312214.1 deoxyribodipyrimidine photo-lyase [Desertifilum sp. FACHB-1129]MBD2323719.1 deoxyribodipyrimidine photo-lyase [Desertifilum sp. FACHB-866]MBD2332416.1 deoxyribodipyrimidine photo-lyase [Desertifilum sp. FACHB-868]OEJ77099.1 deoxyribodipyrimidine photolyase [Desertifilum tharense IPPAS B-1220]
MSDLILFWHRRDLRITDNIGLAKSRQMTPKVIGVFCLDLNILERDDIAPARVTYMIGCLQELQRSYQQAGSQLLILKGQPAQAIPQLADSLQAKAVVWNWDVEPYAQQRDTKVKEALQEKGIQTHHFWDQLLHNPDEIKTKSSNSPYTVYTPFWKQWIQLPKAEPHAKLEKAEALTETEQEQAKKADAIDLPTAKDLGFIWQNDLLLEPGEQAALDQLKEFCSKGIYNYGEQRNFPGTDGTSKLSAALKFGAIGIRTVWDAVMEASYDSRSDETQKNIQTWQHELAWREFYQHAMYHFPNLAEGPYRSEWQDFPWENNQEHFQAWCEGKTGYPIVDAAMRQLNEIGWMHNRCRMIVASFLTKDLIINWQWGETYFLQKLYDGDLSANNGGWQWSASSGMDPKPLRIFNPASQAQKFDPEGDYIREWVPELSSVDTEYLISGKIPPDERGDYPAPIVDHQQRQREFKQRYQQQKG